jgi:hypothetical protein
LDPISIRLWMRVRPRLSCYSLARCLLGRRCPLFNSARPFAVFTLPSYCAETGGTEDVCSQSRQFVALLREGIHVCGRGESLSDDVGFGVLDLFVSNDQYLSDIMTKGAERVR